MSKRNCFEQSNNLFPNNPNEWFSYSITTSNRLEILKNYEKAIEGNTADCLTNNKHVTQNSTADSIKEIIKKTITCYKSRPRKADDV